MNKIVKWSLMLSLVIGGGLLLGGNVIADGEDSTTAGADTVSQAAEVEALQAQAKQLTEQVQAYLSGTATTTAEAVEEVKPEEKKELTQEELDDIEAHVKVIAAKTDIIKTEVAKVVLMRQISTKIAYLQGEVKAMKMAEAEQAAIAAAETTREAETEVAMTGETATSTAEITESEPEVQAEDGENADVEGQIAAIKEKIKDLTAQYEVQKAAEETEITKEVTPEIKCEGGVCSANVNIVPSEGKAETKPETTTTSNTGFWQSVGNFFKNLFTF